MATDDMAVMSACLTDINKFNNELHQHWGISDKGKLSWFIGFKVKWDRIACTISINQYTYIEAMLAKFKLTNAKPESTPMQPGVELMKE